MRESEMRIPWKRTWPKTAFAALVLCAIAAVCGSAQTFTTLHSFCSQGGAACADGHSPWTTLVQATNGYLYGATEAGAYGGGTIFAMTTGGMLNTLYSFCSQGGCADGATAVGLVQATNGEIYGTTAAGGAGNNGAVFKMTQDGSLTTLYSFCVQGPPCTDGSAPNAGLIQASDGFLYGTTLRGGGPEEGSIFRITPAGKLVPLYNFCRQGYPCPDGYDPYGPLLQGADGNLYGTTSAGGAYGGGTIFRITPAGSLTTLYNFCAQAGCADGQDPLGGLLQASDGNLYGTTFLGGANNSGTVFRVAPNGAFASLYSFCAQSQCADGSFPAGALIQSTDGNLYGTTEYGGGTSCYLLQPGCGTIFRFTLGGALTTVHAFGTNGSWDGWMPSWYVALTQDTNGTLYGTTQYGGAGNSGVAFSLSPAYVKLLPASGVPGSAVKILGTNLTGVTSVTFNGVAATFQVVSGSEITATVPAGATTGLVQVFKPLSVVSSNVPFTVQ